MQSNWSVKSYKVSKCACAEATKECGLDLKRLLRKNLFTVSKFHLNTSLGVLKKLLFKTLLIPIGLKNSSPCIHEYNIIFVFHKVNNKGNTIQPN